MDVQHVLLSPKGRIGPRTFLRGFILLTGGYMLMQLAEVFISPVFGLISLGFIYMYVCVFSKRLHDAGQSGWLYLLFLLGYIVVNTIVTMVLLPMLTPHAYEMYMEFFGYVMSGDSSSAEAFMQENQSVLARALSPTLIASFLLSSAVLGFIGSRLPSDPDSNRYGPPPGRGGAANTFS